MNVPRLRTRETRHFFSLVRGKDFAVATATYFRDAAKVGKDAPKEL